MKIKPYLLTVIGLFISISYIIYVEFIREVQADIDYLVTTKSNVFDLKEPIPNPKILYADNNLIDTNESIVLINLRVANTGNVNIKEGDYYSGTEFGFKVIGAKLLKTPEVVHTNIRNVDKTIRYIDSVNSVIIPKIPIDIGEFYEIKFLFIAEPDSLRISPLGKISGVSSIDVMETFRNDKISGDQVPTGLLYFIIGFGLLGLILSLIRWVQRKIKRRAKQKLLNKFNKKYNNSKVPKRIEVLFYKFKKSDFMKLKDVLTDNEKFLKLYESDRSVMKELNKQREYDPILNRIYNDEYCNHMHLYPLRNLFDKPSEIYKENERGINVPSSGLSDKFKLDMVKLFEFLKQN